MATKNTKTKVTKANTSQGEECRPERKDRPLRTSGDRTPGPTTVEALQDAVNGRTTRHASVEDLFRHAGITVEKK